MEKKRAFIFVLITALLVIGLAACTRSKSPGVTTPPTSESKSSPAPGEIVETPVPAETVEVMNQLWLFVTQTAQAAQALGTPAPGIQIPGETPQQPAGQPTGEVPKTITETVQTEAAPVASPTAEVVQQPAPTLAPYPTPTPGIPNSWVLKAGEFPYCLARRYDVDPGQLLSINGLGSGSLLSPGTTLKIPQKTGTFPGQRALRSHPTTYDVGSGDTIYSISCLFGDVDPFTLAAANGLKEPYKLTPGQTLQIP